jgi:transcription antitermination protein NusB
MNKTRPTDTPEHDARRHARLAAVQALYQIALAQGSAAQVIENFRAQPPALDEDGTAMVLDPALFAAIVDGVAQEEAALDEMLAGALDARLSAERLEALLRAILHAGAFELHRHGSVPAAVIINDYVDVAHAFYGGKEPGLVNGVLDRLAKSLRDA